MNDTFLCPTCHGLALKRCRVCKANKPRSEFHHNATKADGLSTTCATCAASVNQRQRIRRGQTSTPRVPKARPVKRHVRLVDLVASKSSTSKESNHAQ